METEENYSHTLKTDCWNPTRSKLCTKPSEQGPRIHLFLRAVHSHSTDCQQIMKLKNKKQKKWVFKPSVFLHTLIPEPTRERQADPLRVQVGVRGWVLSKTQQQVMHFFNEIKPKSNITRLVWSCAMGRVLFLEKRNKRQLELIFLIQLSAKNSLADTF